MIHNLTFPNFAVIWRLHWYKSLLPYLDTSRTWPMSNLCRQKQMFRPFVEGRRRWWLALAPWQTEEKKKQANSTWLQAWHHKLRMFLEYINVCLALKEERWKLTNLWPYCFLYLCFWLHKHLWAYSFLYVYFLVCKHCQHYHTPL